MTMLTAQKTPFSERPFYSDSEIERTCTTELSWQSLLPTFASPIRIDRFIEKRFKLVPTYEDLGDGVLGLTRFTAHGVAEIAISRRLDDEVGRVSERRIRTTLAHEAGHCLLHAHLFTLATKEHSLFGDFADPLRPKILCREKITKYGYHGDWWEYQANRAMSSLLMPKELTIDAAEQFLETRGFLGMRFLAPAKKHEAVRQLAETFDVNPIVAQIRLETLFPEVEGQISL